MARLHWRAPARMDFGLCRNDVGRVVFPLCYGAVPGRTPAPGLSIQCPCLCGPSARPTLSVIERSLFVTLEALEEERLFRPLGRKSHDWRLGNETDFTILSGLAILRGPGEGKRNHLE